MQSKKELWSDNTHVIGFDRECFPTFWGGVNRLMQFGECVTIAKSDGCNVRNLIQKGLLQTLPFTRNLTLTSNPLLGNGLQNQSRKSIHSQRIFERYWSLYIEFFMWEQISKLWGSGLWCQSPKSINISKPWSCRPLVSQKGLYKLLKTLFVGFGNGYTV